MEDKIVVVAERIAYQILGASTEAGLHREPVWDSGKIDSDQSIHVPYSGPSLVSGQRVYWKVRIWDETGTEVESSPAWWEMGLLERTDWIAQWIGTPFFSIKSTMLQNS